MRNYVVCRRPSRFSFHLIAIRFLPGTRWNYRQIGFWLQIRAVTSIGFIRNYSNEASPSTFKLDSWSLPSIHSGVFFCAFVNASQHVCVCVSDPLTIWRHDIRFQIICLAIHKSPRLIFIFAICSSNAFSHQMKIDNCVVSAVIVFFFFSISDQRFLCIFWWNWKQKNEINSFSGITNRQTDLAVAKVANCNEFANRIFSWTNKKSDLVSTILD